MNPRLVFNGFFFFLVFNFFKVPLFSVKKYLRKLQGAGSEREKIERNSPK